MFYFNSDHRIKNKSAFLLFSYSTFNKWEELSLANSLIYPAVENYNINIIDSLHFVVENRDNLREIIRTLREYRRYRFSRVIVITNDFELAQDNTVQGYSFKDLIIDGTIDVYAPRERVYLERVEM
jgi:hypothetical protein